MGMRNYSFELINKGLSAIGMPGVTYLRRASEEDSSRLAGLNFLELGPQLVRGAHKLSSKVFFQEYGVNHFSIDLNGCHGSLPMNIASEYLEEVVSKVSGVSQFDVVTNYGTTEHIDPFEVHYDVFRNVDRLCRVGGVMLHEVPIVGHWKGHSPIHYHRDFFPELAAACGYEVIAISFPSPDATRRKSVSCGLRKTREGFCGRADFPAHKIERSDDGYRGRYAIGQKLRRQVFIDLGAHVGDSIQKAMSIFPECDSYYGIEPCLATFKELDRRMSKNPKVELIRAAADLEDGHARLYLRGRHNDIGCNKSNSLIKSKFNVDENKFEIVPTMDFVRWFGNFDDDDFIILKMDIEGKEYDLLEAMIERGVISKVDIIFCEWHERKMLIKRGRHQNLIERLRGFGFNLTGRSREDEFHCE